MFVAGGVLCVRKDAAADLQDPLQFFKSNEGRKIRRENIEEEKKVKLKKFKKLNQKAAKIGAEVVMKEVKSTMKEESKPSTVQEGDQNLSLKVQDASVNTTQSKIETATALKNLMSAYCERNGLDVQSIQFTFDGQQVTGADTAASVGLASRLQTLEEGDTIEVSQEQEQEGELTVAC